MTVSKLSNCAFSLNRILKLKSEQLKQNVFCIYERTRDTYTKLLLLLINPNIDIITLI